MKIRRQMVLDRSAFRVPVLCFADTIKADAVCLGTFPFSVTPDIFWIMIDYFHEKGTMN